MVYYKCKGEQINNNMKKKKIITSIAGAAAVAVPVVAVTACTERSKPIQMPAKPTATVVDDFWAECGDVGGRFQCYDNGEATLVEVQDVNATLVIPARVWNGDVSYEVTRIAKCNVPKSVHGLDFSEADCLKIIDDRAFEHWYLFGNHCNFNFADSDLETIGYKAFDNAMDTGIGRSNKIDLIKFPRTIKSIGEEAFGQHGHADPHVLTIVFMTRDENAIKNIKFGANWQPDDQDSCVVSVPTEEAKAIYEQQPNFNPRGYTVRSGALVECGDMSAWFTCNDTDHTATMIDCENKDGVLVIPEVIRSNGDLYNVTKIAKLDVRKKVDGIDFSEARNLQEIAPQAFEHWYFYGSDSNFDFSWTKLETIGEKAFDNAMDDDRNDIDRIEFPSTIKYIGAEAFGQTGKCDPTTNDIWFRTVYHEDIQKIQFGENWQPNEKDYHSVVHVPAGTKDVYKSVENFNPRNIDIEEF